MSDDVDARQPDYGVYSIQQAARLLDVSASKVRSWVCGSKKLRPGPLIPTSIQRNGRPVAINFVNLMEVRFVAAFADAGLHVRTIRALLEEAQRVLKDPHPFASKAVFSTDGYTIFAEIKVPEADDTVRRELYNLRNRNWAFRPLVEPLLKGHVEYSTGGRISAWQPRPQRTPAVVIDPRFAFGQPVLRNRPVPTRTLYDAYLAEGDLPIERVVDNVAAWFGVKPAEVREAVDFEASLGFTAQAA